MILSAIFLANLPFFSERYFGIWPLSLQHKEELRTKSLAWRMLELVVFYLLLGLLTRWLEQQHGNIYPQKWEFYAITACMFLVMAFPGYVWRYLRRQSAS
ncbi:DUF2818 family protein [Parvibium lacunae]|uniref:DUF2818 family protein n=1 Tax=Parvibium lacunae TaxID=1888893 RepID=A0A368L582_9BURK|nr:DUF2818 family protein [Parvibium lacunae]